jgi:hypothetical protein
MNLAKAQQIMGTCNAGKGGVGRGFGTFGLILLSGLQKKEK